MLAATAKGAPFVVRTGPCAGSYDGIFISTDLEPDDAAALKAIAPRLRGTPLLVVVGEGNAPAGAKCSLAAEMLASYSLDEHATIVQGRASSASYPAAALRAYNSADGAPRPHRAIIVADESEEAVADRVADFCGHCEAPFALLLSSQSAERASGSSWSFFRTQRFASKLSLAGMTVGLRTISTWPGCSW